MTLPLLVRSQKRLAPRLTLPSHRFCVRAVREPGKAFLDRPFFFYSYADMNTK
jgi:hypothetical protein